MSEKTMSSLLSSFMEEVLDQVGCQLVSLEEPYTRYEVTQRTYDDTVLGKTTRVNLLVYDGDAEPPVSLTYTPKVDIKRLTGRKWDYEAEEHVDMEVYLPYDGLNMNVKEIFDKIVKKVTNLRWQDPETFSEI